MRIEKGIASRQTAEESGSVFDVLRREVETLGKRRKLRGAESGKAGEAGTRASSGPEALSSAGEGVERAEASDALLEGKAVDARRSAASAGDEETVQDRQSQNESSKVAPSLSQGAHARPGDAATEAAAAAPRAPPASVEGAQSPLSAAGERVDAGGRQSIARAADAPLATAVVGLAAGAAKGAPRAEPGEAGFADGGARGGSAARADGVYRLGENSLGAKYLAFPGDGSAALMGRDMELHFPDLRSDAGIVLGSRGTGTVRGTAVSGDVSFRLAAAAGGAGFALQTRMGGTIIHAAAMRAGVLPANPNGVAPASRTVDPPPVPKVKAVGRSEPSDAGEDV